MPALSAAVSLRRLLQGCSRADCSASGAIPRLPEPTCHRASRKGRQRDRRLLAAAKSGFNVDSVTVADAKARLFRHHGAPKPIMTPQPYGWRCANTGWLTRTQKHKAEKELDALSQTVPQVEVVPFMPTSSVSFNGGENECKTKRAHEHRQQSTLNKCYMVLSSIGILASNIS